MAAEEQKPALAGDNEKELQRLRDNAIQLAASLIWLPDRRSSDTFPERCRALVAQIDALFKKVDAAFARAPESEDLLWLRDNGQELSSAARAVAADLSPLTHLPHAYADDELVPRVLAIAERFFSETCYMFSEREFAEFCLAFEQITALEFREIGLLVPALKLVLLEQIADMGTAIVKDPLRHTPTRITTCIRALRDVTQASWKDILEVLVPFDRILHQDPTGTYALMDIESRNVYRESVSRIARRSDRTESEVAEEALGLALQAHSRRYSDPRISSRESHIGYYLVAEGTALLSQKVGFHSRFGERVRIFIRTHPDEFLLLGIAILTLLIITLLVSLLTAAATPPLVVLLSMLVLLLPSSQAAVQLMNYLTTALLPVQTLPKLDFSEDVPNECITLVAIPTLLLNEKQVHALIEDLEVRYLGNHDRNIHFALVSDLPDAQKPSPEDSALVASCSKLIEELNERYAANNSGSFFHLHRHRVYNPREKKWIGWERKRGKLHDLNQLILGKYDSFPIKVGNLPVLSKVRFVITLDSDTELPRGSAHRLIGALAHPLNQAIIDPIRNVVVAGYGILQPRVGVSVQSTSRSRLAALFAGETGLDPYTRAVSDAYQDLYGEGTFAGKGIYEVDTMLRVLDQRFPRNNLLSHDLIEGAYARAGLVTDVVVIEDYPSRYGAYNRRKHRWLRGDWQIAEWLTGRVPNESGARVPNPISLVSRWKILDNLRRSLVEPATFALLLFAWLATGHPAEWTLAAVCILFAPAWVEFAFALVRAIVQWRARVARDAVRNVFAANFTVLLTLTLLAHQTLLSLDAVVRAIVRYLFTRENMLEWETAAEAELGKRQTPIDRYLDWIPVLSIGLGVLIWLMRPHSLFAALPILALWACSKRFAIWLDASPIEGPSEITVEESRLLHRSSLYIWRYFAEFSNEEHNWLVPDNVQDKPRKIAASISPTNMGLLLNARQVAAELGYITVPEMVDLTQKTLATIWRLPKHHGHPLNWYDTRTLEPKNPLFVSSVDSGNLVASLWTLRQGCLDLLRRPLLSKTLADGLLDYLRVLANLKVLRKRSLSHYEAGLRSEDWLAFLLDLPDGLLEGTKSQLDSSASPDATWFQEQTLLRIIRFRELLAAYMPWRLPEFAELTKKLADGIDLAGDVPLQHLPDLVAKLSARLDDMLRSLKNGDGAVVARLSHMLSEAHSNALHLIDSLGQISKKANDLASDINFAFLLDRQRLQMSVGFDVQSDKLQPYYYDLLATEPRTTVFIAIAKDEIPQESWFRLNRPYASDHGRPLLLSWTGTMFEYLMPSLWMRSYPNTLLDRACAAAVRAQQEYAAHKDIPWGISESACSRRNDSGDYHYEAFGVPNLALRKNGLKPLVVSPYSTFLALNVDRKGALSNLRRMEALGWFGPYGFIEAADYTARSHRILGVRCELVATWMVHHQGMSLLALANLLCENVVQRWFHSNRRVQATELLLQEKPVIHVRAA